MLIWRFSTSIMSRTSKKHTCKILEVQWRIQAKWKIVGLDFLLSLKVSDRNLQIFQEGKRTLNMLITNQEKPNGELLMARQWFKLMTIREQCETINVYYEEGSWEMNNGREGKNVINSSHHNDCDPDNLQNLHKRFKVFIQWVSTIFLWELTWEALNFCNEIMQILRTSQSNIRSGGKVSFQFAVKSHV